MITRGDLDPIRVHSEKKNGTIPTRFTQYMFVFSIMMKECKRLLEYYLLWIFKLDPLVFIIILFTLDGLLGFFARLSVD